MSQPQPPPPPPHLPTTYPSPARNTPLSIQAPDSRPTTSTPHPRPQAQPHPQQQPLLAPTPTPTLAPAPTPAPAPAQSETPTPAESAQRNSSGEPKKKRPRAAQACDRCRAKKYKCDESFPCFYCRKHGYDCIYQGSTPRAWERTVNASYVESLEKKVQQLEANTQSSTTNSPGINQHRLPNLDRQNSSLDHRTDEQQPTDPAPATRHGPVSSTTAHGQTASIHQNSSRVRSRDHDTSRNRSAEDDSLSEAPLETEIRDLNTYTENLEYYGPNSHIGLLGKLQRRNQPHEPLPSVVSLLHNSAFSPRLFGSGQTENTNELHITNKFYFRVAHTFMEGYFESLHYIHPIIDKSEFLLRAENLWFGRPEKTTFKGLYLTLMSLGALMRMWDGDKIEGLTRLEWCRKLFDEAQVYFHETAMSFDLETVQGFFLSAKVFQNQLAPQLAYMYLGIGVRTALAAGYNRSSLPTRIPSVSSTTTTTTSSTATAMSLTWWGLYSLEVEFSFSLGRPDSLGVDAYHNQHIPFPTDHNHSTTNETSIIGLALPLARLTRRVSVEIYHSVSSITHKLALAADISTALDAWVEGLPAVIRPDTAVAASNEHDLRDRDPRWARRQRTVLGIRYRNLQMALYRPFLAYYARTSKSQHSSSTATASVSLLTAVSRCIAAAIDTIAMLHTAYCRHGYLRTWWWNVTYISFPASVLLLYVARMERTGGRVEGERSEIVGVGVGASKEEILKSVKMAVEVLETMDECVVAGRAAQLIGQSLREVQGVGASVANVASEAAASAQTHTQGPRPQEARMLPIAAPSTTVQPAPVPQMHESQHFFGDDFAYCDLLLEEGWGTLFDDFNTSVAALV